MNQITFKISENDHEFLSWYSGITARSKSSIYRDVTLKEFTSWKISILLEEYAKGVIGFKQLCRLGNLSFQEASLLLEKKKIDPPISRIMDEYTSSVAEKLNQK
ncbi:MAG: hypothetical protein IH840_09885 [Candidatus Heimdallarchaeota archaeon]|nr:hypothetical protein [Candidatus Heimdallarchaeota archaeon]